MTDKERHELEGQLKNAEAEKEELFKALSSLTVKKQEAHIAYDKCVATIGVLRGQLGL